MMAGHSLWWWYLAICSLSIMGSMMRFYILQVEKTNITPYNRPESKTLGDLPTVMTTQRASTARYTVRTTLSPVVRAKQMRQVTLHCKTVCSKSAADICVPLDLAIFVYKNDTPTDNMTFNLQKYNPVVHIARESNTSHESSVLDVERCNLEEHFPGVELIPRQTSCAVIGNSGILNNSSCGDYINSHDFVIRANMGLIKGYESDVGKKSSLNAFNRGLLTAYGNAFLKSKEIAEKPEILLRFLEHIRTLKESILWYPKHLVKSGGVHPASQQYRAVIDTIKKNGLSGIRFAFNWKPIQVEKAWGLPMGSATLGLDMYAVARTFCSNISLFGFYPFYKDLEGRAVKYHYFDNGKFNFSLKTGHHFALEHTKLKELEKQGKLNLVVRDCKPKKHILV
ncbi:CMP-N-acetylneuraminate-poly-alpha-2,8-sialyltransferase-like [Patiria miniata]|uniref:Uncharacterized protein n=1 Tax=Patiria miniata TaxID=46514 RepID=A0A914AEG4_PATMI|nr:CMP-N-acetylneuraminate-poly-alpha-2,8-sialyltransferase-like [Patiria miniata]